MTFYIKYVKIKDNITDQNIISAMLIHFQVATLREDVTDPAKQTPVTVEISENQIDQVMSMLNEADPTAPESDPTGRSWCFPLSYTLDPRYVKPVRK